MPEGVRPRERGDAPQPASKRHSITERIRGTFGQARKDKDKDKDRDAVVALPRRASTAAKQQRPVQRIRDWLDDCNAEHHHHCNAGSGPGPEADLKDIKDSRPVKTWRPVWLVDAVDRRLVRAKPTDRYLALSYVWGAPLRRGESPPMAQTLKANLDAFEQSLPEEDIPQTFLDAMWLCKRLGIRHLWVDRLCIVQDDEEDQESNLRHMPFVFANAYLTIIAAHGDADTGLLALNPKRTGRGLRTAGTDHHELVAASRWGTRGWTLQERMYSRRAVFIFEDTLTWVCHCELWQDSNSGIMKAVRGSKRHVCTNPVQPAAFAFHHAPWPDLDEYARIVMDFSSRRLTLVEDTLRAFSGITHVLSTLYPNGFIYGMPLMFLDIAMLWRPQASIRRRAMSRPPFLPSWSWMGWWFDGVPVDLILWRAAADYIDETRVGKQDSKRFRSPHAFKIRPTISWSLTDRSATVPVESTGLQFRDLRSRRASTTQSLPPGWTRKGSHYHHDSDETTSFKYPIPVEDPPEPGEYGPAPGEKAFPGPFLSFETTVGFFEVDYLATMGPRDSMNPPIAVGNIWNKARRWAGQFRAHDGWLGIQSSNYDGEEKLEFIAISTATERRGSHVFDVERFEEHMNDDESIDIVNVLWIERIAGVAYRRGVGHILQKVWEVEAKDQVGILLG